MLAVSNGGIDGLVTAVVIASSIIIIKRQFIRCSNMARVTTRADKGQRRTLCSSCFLSFNYTLVVVKT